ncbi:MAG TPA: hypothetical protein VH087_11840, partial [Thermoanaerobaculia bacterium]|nr:hypothetical protein [Thermoanaerobaculia bacterium]
AAKPAEHCERGKAVVYSDGDVTYANGISMDDLSGLRRAYGHHFAYFERGGQGYLITDADTLDRIAAVYEPQQKLGRQQAELGQKQGALGAQQAELGREQARIGMRRAAHDQSESLERRQEELGKQQDKLGEKQDALGKQQEAMGQQQEEFSRQAERQIAVIFDQAIRTGIAKKR